MMQLLTFCLLVRLDEKPNNPADDFATIRFGDGDEDERGELDRFCGLERSYYFIAGALVSVPILSARLASNH